MQSLMLVLPAVLKELKQTDIKTDRIVIYSSGFQTMGRDPLVGPGRNFSGSRKSFKI